MAQTIENIIEIETPVEEGYSHASSKVKNRLLPLFLQFGGDVLAFISSYFVIYYIVFESGFFDKPGDPDFLIIIIPAIVLMIYWTTVFFFSGLYKNWYERSPFDEIFTVIKASFIGCGIIFILMVRDDTSIQRMMILLYFISISSFAIIFRTIARKMQIKLRGKGVISFHSIILGPADKAINLYQQILKSPNWGIKPIGAILSNHDECLKWNDINEQQKSGLPLLGTEEDFSNILNKSKPEEVLITSTESSQSRLLDIVNTCAEKNIVAKIEPDLYHIFTGQTRTHNIYGIPLIEISPQLMKPWQEVLKRIFDIIFSLLVIVLGAPIWLLVAIIIKLESKGPVFYKQPRTGKNEKVFQIFKFRSMQSGADKKGRTWTQVNDPRVTRFGKFIRKTHIDEVPQFLNVLIGDMSIVGPRPEQPHFVEDFAREIPYYKRRLKVRPGITGWWQVKYQAHELNVEEIENRLKDDFYYIENMSIKFDIEIIVRTVWCVLTGHGQA